VEGVVLDIPNWLQINVYVAARHSFSDSLLQREGPTTQLVGHNELRMLLEP
jgi:hypothetical protein